MSQIPESFVPIPGSSNPNGTHDLASDHDIQGLFIFQNLTPYSIKSDSSRSYSGENYVSDVSSNATRTKIVLPSRSFMLQSANILAVGFIVS